MFYLGQTINSSIHSSLVCIILWPKHMDEQNTRRTNKLFPTYFYFWPNIILNHFAKLLIQSTLRSNKLIILFYIFLKITSTNNYIPIKNKIKLKRSKSHFYNTWPTWLSMFYRPITICTSIINQIATHFS